MLESTPRRLTIAAVIALVAVASADSSVVVLALPELLQRFNASIVGVSWVVSAYNLAVVVGTAVLLLLRGRARVTLGARGGAALFLVGSLACSVAPDLATLVAARCVQGVGAALLLVRALPLLVRLGVPPARAVSAWAGAAAFGAVVGPAAGGALTEWLGWRTIFIAQTPFAAAAIGLVSRQLEQPSTTARAPSESRLRVSRALASLLVSASLVGLLFLAIIELVDVRGLSPLRAAALAMTTAVGALIAAPFARRPGAPQAGAILLAGGLAGMALLPTFSLVWPVISLSLAGLGYGLLVPALTPEAATTGEPSQSALAATIGLRHLGLVLGLSLLAPLLSSSLNHAAPIAEQRGISVVLHAPASISSKAHLAIDLAPTLARPTSEGIPNVKEAVEAHSTSPVLRALANEIDHTFRATLLRAFRPAFLTAALLALLACLLLGPQPPAPWRRRLRLLLAAAVLAAGLATIELASGGLTYGKRPALQPPCANDATIVGGSFDAKAQRASLKALQTLSCHLHENPEQLLAHTASSSALLKLLDAVTRLRKLGL